MTVPRELPGRKFQSHPVVPPVRLIELATSTARCGVVEVQLLRGFEPHLHPQTESSGVVWGRPSPPALIVASGALLEGLERITRGLSRHRTIEGLVEPARGLPSPGPWARSDEVAPRSYGRVVPAGCCSSTTTIAYLAQLRGSGRRQTSWHGLWATGQWDPSRWPLHAMLRSSRIWVCSGGS